MIDAAVLFERHDRLRARGVPVVSVAAGPVGLGLRVWRTWAAAGRREAIAAVGPSPAGLVGPWCDCFSLPDLIRPAASLLNEPDADWLVTRLRGMTDHDFRTWWAARPLVDDPSPIAVLLRQALAPGAPKLSVDRAADWFPADREPVLALAAGLAELVGPDRLPALAVTAPPQVGAEWIAVAVGGLLALVERVPRLPVALLAPAGRIDEYLAAAGESRSAAAVREGLIRITGLSEAELLARATTGAVRPVPDATVHDLAALGASNDLAEALTELARHPARPADAVAEDAARSAAERLLFQALEHDAETAGLFELNRALDFAHGRRAAEGDLVSAKLKLAIELDGVYFHLADAAQYRRDREKDWGYQRHGYLVLRFLSEDVAGGLGRILSRVREAVRHRRATPQAAESA